VWSFDGTHIRDFDGPFVEWEEDRVRRAASPKTRCVNGVIVLAAQCGKK